jgi:predicted nucleotidyltransferase component of viral defense system
LPVSRLTELQRQVLLEFFKREQRFFLTGGAALAGFHLGHRETDDLDFFSPADVLDQGTQALDAVAALVGATLQRDTDAPAFKRFVLRRGSESVKIDLVHDIHQLLPKLVVDGFVRIDPPEEIMANKLCTLLSRSEIRDLVDLRALEAAGQNLEVALGRGMEKDRGLTPGQLLAVLSEIRIGEDALIPGGVSASELREYLDGLINRLARLAFPT